MLLLLAGVLAALVQYLLPTAPEAPSEAGIQASRATSARPEIRTIPPAPPPSPPPAPEAAEAGLRSSPPPPAPVQVPQDALAFPAPPPSAAPGGEAEVAHAEESEGPPAIALVDLNTASVAELNHLKGGGAIGRAIIARRPYTQVGDLLTKRVLSRAVFERIREQVTVR